MTGANDFRPDWPLDWTESNDDPLVERLRELRWAEAPAEARERCWEAIQTRMNEPGGADEAPARPKQPATKRLNECDRLTFSTWLAPRRTTVAEGWSRARHLMPAH